MWLIVLYMHHIVPASMLLRSGIVAECVRERVDFLSALCAVCMLLVFLRTGRATTKCWPAALQALQMDRGNFCQVPTVVSCARTSSILVRDLVLLRPLFHTMSCNPARKCFFDQPASSPRQ